MLAELGATLSRTASACSSGRGGWRRRSHDRVCSGYRWRISVTDVLQTERRGRHVRVLTLNRPDPLNAMNAELCGALHQAVNELRDDRSCRAVVVTGAGRGFCAGVDLHGCGAAQGRTGLMGRATRLCGKSICRA
jgi:Enoyl-CoA hydratase/isomerase